VTVQVSMSDWGRADDPHNGSRARAPQTGAEGRNSRLCSLLRAVAKTDGVQRVLISSLDPADVDDEFLATVARTPNICPHIHLALQSGSAGVLRAMRRRYTPAMFRRAAQRWREICPEGGLTTDIIVGFPGETAADFEASMQIAADAAFSAIHVFPYSPRQGTAASQLEGAVPAAEQTARVARLLELGRQLSKEYAAQFLGQTLPIMVEGDAGDSLEGLTPHYLKACIPAPQHSYRRGDIAWFTAHEWRDGCLHGSLQAAPQGE
jgi:threonylcarbamoyladenosine tRNA methylthiotransferase MtaB